MAIAAAVGVLGLGSCSSMKSFGKTLTKMGLNPFEKTQQVSATVVHASTPRYEAGGEHIMGKGKGEIKTTAGYHQNITVKTAAGKTYSGSIKVSSSEACVHVGDKGIAEIGLESDMLKNFEKSY